MVIAIKTAARRSKTVHCFFLATFRYIASAKFPRSSINASRNIAMGTAETITFCNRIPDRSPERFLTLRIVPSAFLCLAAGWLKREAAFGRHS